MGKPPRIGPQFLMKVYTSQNVYDAALDRIRWVFREFENVVVDISGGKDSTVTLFMALQVAEEMGRLPLRVLFIDQEAEWDCVIRYVRELMADPRVEPVWLQVPIKLFNATSQNDPWLMCWEPGAKWLRDKEPVSIKENVFGTDRFKEMFGAYLEHTFPNSPAASLAGVRCEESPGRMRGLTTGKTYKDVTWGAVKNSKLKHFTFYPLYDWSYTDIWKAIHDHKWPYCELYDVMYQYGVAVRDMRVSNVHHETAVKSLHWLQEIEGDLWNRLTERLAGVNTVGHMKRDWQAPKQLPWMFSDWKEYRDHLVDNLIEDEVMRKRFREIFDKDDDKYPEEIEAKLRKIQIDSVLSNDYHGTKLGNFRAAFAFYRKRKSHAWRDAKVA